MEHVPLSIVREVLRTYCTASLAEYLIETIEDQSQAEEGVTTHER